MKYIGLITLPTIALALMSCDALNKPLDGGDASNPLDPPGRGDAIATTSDPYGPTFTAGTFLQTVSPQTAFFANFPKQETQPTKTLSDYTDVKVISTRGSYVKIEVVDTGEVGYVPSVMLGEKRSPNEVAVTPGAGEVQVTPGIAPDAIDTAPDVSPDIPGGGVAPDPEVPGIKPPEVVNPNLPAE